MSPHPDLSPRLLLVLLGLCVISGASTATADVIILEGNDVPLSGTIVSETETTVRFRIRGLSENSYVEIGKDRIKMSWREASDETLRGREERLSPVVPPDPPPVATRPADPAGPPPRTPDEIRDRHLSRLRARLEGYAPGATGVGSLTVVLVLGFGLVLIWIGGRLVDMEDMGIPQCAVLSLLTTVLLVVTPVLLVRMPDARARVALVVLAVACWILFVRFVVREPLRKAVLLLSFLALSSSLVGLVGVAILSVF